MVGLLAYGKDGNPRLPTSSGKGCSESPAFLQYLG